MIPEIGHFSLILAFMCAVCGALLPLMVKKNCLYNYHAKAVQLTRLECAFVLASMLSLFWAFFQCDLSVQYVQQNAHQTLPFYYRLTALWGSHEGSMLLWIQLFCCWRVWVSYRQQALPDTVHASILSLLSILSIGFLLFTLLTSNPFLRFLPQIPVEGSDLNPLLQDPGLIFHPPLLYMGYVGLSVPFAAQMATLFFPEQAKRLATWSRFWVLSAWAFLTIGIVLGSYWAYYELGWGGYWFWDPVENASFMPWLVTAALAHSLIVTQKRQVFQGWTVLLAIYAFGLSLIGTFLVRSGVLTSVHAFAVSPERGLYILAFLTTVLATSLVVFCLRVHFIKRQGQFALISKEIILLVNNIFLVVLASTILLGTLYPLIIDALLGEKISVGAPYFNAVFVPIVLPLVFIMGLAPSINFYQDNIVKKIKNMGLGLFIVLIILCAAGFYTKAWAFSVGVAVAGWLMMATLKLGAKRYHMGRLGAPACWGMLLAHFGIGVVILGLSIAQQFSVEKDLDLAVSEQVTVGDYQIVFRDLRAIQGPNYEGVRAYFDILKQDKLLKTVQPEKRYYIPRNMPMTETAIDSNPLRDIYIALSEPTNDNRWAVRVYYKPFVIWIWLGGLMVALGCFAVLLPTPVRVIQRESNYGIEKTA